MKQMLQKSRQLIIFFISAAILFSIGFTTMQESYQRVSVSPDYLSSEYYKIKVKNQADNSSGLSTQELYEYCKKNMSSSLVYQSYDMSKGKSVFFTNTNKFAPKIISGRNFTQKDFETQSNTAIVSNEVKDECINRGAKTYLVHGSAEYEVVGVYEVPKTDNSDIVVPAKYFINMCAKANAKNIDAQYLFDTQNLSANYSAMQEYINNKYPDIQLDCQEITLGGKNALKRSISFSPLIYVALLVTVILVLLNAAVTSENWITARKKEIAVRKLCGATSAEIKLMLLRDYLIVISISYLIGVLITETIIHLGFFKFMGTNVHLLGAIVGYIVCIICGIITGFIAISHQLKRDIVLQIR